jgi:hypothetical protein
MPIPFIAIAVGVGATLLGVGKGVKAAVDTKDANDYNRWANSEISDAKKCLKVCRKASNTALEALGGKKLFVLDKGITRFVSAFERLQNVELEASPGFDELKKFRLDKQALMELKEMGSYAGSILGGAASGAVGGALAAFGAYSGVMFFGAASTGTAIATLSGVAATNATLAFLGGGSLAAGGLGMAGGAMVLGGLVAGPALAIMGFIIGAKASENLDKARSNYIEAKKAAEELNVASLLCNGIRRRAVMFERLLIRLEAIFIPLVFQTEAIIASCGVNWQKYGTDEKKTIAAAASIAKAIKSVLDTPILSEDGKLTEESEKIAGEIKQILARQVAA